MDRKSDEKVFKNEIIDVEEIVAKIIAELKVNSRDSEKNAEQIIRNALNEKKFLE
ncbi:MAG: hypothetical protein ACTSUL_02215 [Promethearchaeota archaeon]